MTLSDWFIGKSEAWNLDLSVDHFFASFDFMQRWKACPPLSSQLARWGQIPPFLLAMHFFPKTICNIDSSDHSTLFSFVPAAVAWAFQECPFYMWLWTCGMLCFWRTSVKCVAKIKFRISVYLQKHNTVYEINIKYKYIKRISKIIMFIFVLHSVQHF